MHILPDTEEKNPLDDKSTHIRKKPATLAEVAAIAGVSTQTVSYVVSGNTKVTISQPTRERVLAAAAQVGYQPNRLARAMKSGKTMTIALWLPIQRPAMAYYMKFIRFLQARASEGGYELMVIPVTNEQAYGDGGLPPTHWPADGIIALDCSRAVRKYREQTPFDQVPVVSISISEMPNVDRISLDVLGGFEELTKTALAEQGELPTFVTIRAGLKASRELRKVGYDSVADLLGLTPRYISCVGESARAAEVATIRDVRTYGIQKSYLCWNDTVAWGVMRALSSSEFSSDTADVKIYSYGGYEPDAPISHKMVVLPIPLELIAKRAWHILHERIQNPNQPFTEEILELSPIELESHVTPRK
jgi:DNA-binding LacI/PurR family transcriptional regulator